MKKKIHVNSLLHNGPVASHDCPRCIKRRIRYDRSFPKCEKCASRNLQCPGFKLLYRKWDQGIASRGKLKGKRNPILEPRESSDKSMTSDKHSIQEQRASALEAVPYSSDTISTTSPGKDTSLTKGYTSDQAFKNLHHHFFHEAVPRFRWIDLPDNPWRNIIQPVAQDPRCLQLTMACHAAAHLSITWTGPDDIRTSFRAVYHHLGDSSLLMLKERIHFDLLCESNTPKFHLLGTFPADILASILLLCYADAFIPGSVDWKIHLRACQIVIRSHVSQGQLTRRNGSPKAFLLKEVADLEILSGISTFNRNSNPSTYSFSQHVHSSSPWTFTQLIDKITTMERHRYNSIRSQQRIPDVQLQLLHQQAAEAYFGVLAAIDSYPEQPSARKCLETVILSY